MSMRNNLLAVAGAAALGLTLQAGAASTYTASVTLSFGDISHGEGGALGTNGTSGVPQVSPYLCASGTCFSGNFDGSGDKTWTGSGANTLALPNGNVLFSQRNLDEDNNGALGNNGTSFYNPYDELRNGAQNYTAYGQPDCTLPVAGFVFPYSCYNSTYSADFATPVTSIGPAASATGTVTVNPTAGTITGTLALQQGPQSAATVAYDYRFGDGAPFNAAQDKVSTQATIVLNLKATFSPTGAWTITGGSATFNDPALICVPGDLSGTLCLNNNVAFGAHRADGSHLSWLDAPINDQTTGGPFVSTGCTPSTTNACLPGVVGGATLAGATITASGEGHRPSGNNMSGCPNSIPYNAVKQDVTGTAGDHYFANILCGFVSVVSWNLTGTVTGTDTDLDGVPDAVDNCVNVSNANQRDTNGDGYGNICDPDFDGNLTVNINDFNRLKARLNITPVVDVDTDLDGNNAVNVNDLNRLKSFLTKPPGPSGLRP